jgi:hypothetical protein
MKEKKVEKEEEEIDNCTFFPVTNNPNPLINISRIGKSGNTTQMTETKFN